MQPLETGGDLSVRSILTPIGAMNQRRLAVYGLSFPLTISSSQGRRNDINKEKFARNKPSGRVSQSAFSQNHTPVPDDLHTIAKPGVRLFIGAQS